MKKEQTKLERMETVAAGVKDWAGVDMDALYHTHFADEVDLHDWRTFCRQKRRYALEQETTKATKKAA